MSEYQKRKAQAKLIQQEKEELLRRELAEKAQRDKETAKAEDERRKRQEAASKEARRLELVKANAALHQNPSQKEDEKQRLAYDPFAEDERPINPSNGSRLNAITKPRKPTSTIRESQSGPSKSPANPTSRTKSAPRGTSPIPLSRKEKASQEFARTAMRSTTSDSLFSARAYHDLPPSSPIPTGRLVQPTPRSNGPATVVNSNGRKKGGMKMGAGLELRKLAPGRDKWDRRTIDEIQTDIRREKGKVRLDDDVSRTVGGDRGRKKSRSPIKDRSVLPNSSRSAPNPHLTQAVRPASLKKRPRSPSSSSSSSSTPPPPRKSKLQDPNLDPNNISAQIQALFRRPGRPVRNYNDVSDSESDMEVGLGDLEREERETARIARLEDEADEREEKLRKEEKERIRKGAGKK